MMSISKDAVREDDVPVLELQLERTSEAPSLARAAVAGFSDDRGLSPSTISTLVLLVSEIVTNAVIHPDADLPGMISLCARLDHGTVRIEVSDPGSGFTPSPRDPDHLAGGYGLYLLDKQSARWGVEPTPRTRVWFELDTAS
jgi:anti-sigma regulatory factor (Ser/Thr protein kinase)